MGTLDDDLEGRLTSWRSEGLERELRVLEGSGPVVRWKGRDFLNFCSNDYLGLANHPEITQALKEGADRWGVGSGASHLVTGHTQAHHR